mmetsp:Transcript_26759/g.32441  ORF Transcript_26759/g.32441 Transcript_26759/m.32441 type:complete len:161 (-) Transcript_26759:239-721(-)
MPFAMSTKMLIFALVISLICVGILLTANVNSRRNEQFSAARELAARTQHAYSNYGSRITVKRPRKTKEGDVLFLFLSRTDDVLPLELKGWESAASCFKRGNAQEECSTIDDCVKLSGNGRYCEEFSNGSRGLDLATVVFYRRATDDDDDVDEYDGNQLRP